MNARTFAAFAGAGLVAIGALVAYALKVTTTPPEGLVIHSAAKEPVRARIIPITNSLRKETP